MIPKAPKQQFDMMGLSNFNVIFIPPTNDVFSGSIVGNKLISLVMFCAKNLEHFGLAFFIMIHVLNIFWTYNFLKRKFGLNGFYIKYCLLHALQCVVHILAQNQFIIPN
jgi:hypothetical protein